MSAAEAGLHFEQAPPLAIPLSFFLTAPLAAAAAGAVLLWKGSETLVSGWSPVTLGLTHLGTLGFLSMVMMGALYQMAPVVAGSPVPGVRSAHVVHPLWTLGVISLAYGLGAGSELALWTAVGALGVALVVFLGPMGLALARAPYPDETVRGMRVALLALFATGMLGLWMAHGHVGLPFPGPRPLWRQVHLSLGLLGWVGGLIAAVSWQVLPMFYLAAPVGRRARRATQTLISLGVALPTLVLAADWTGALARTDGDAARLAALGTLPAAAAVWGLHPLLSFRGLRQRRRRRIDGSLLFWQAALATAPLTALTAAAAHLLLDPRWGLLFGWLALWGWAGMIVHGMLTRIVPFLVWLHRFAPRVGELPTPSARGLLPDRRTRWGFALHLASVAAGALAILSGSGGLARITGALLLATALDLLASLLHVARQRPAPSA